MSQRRRQWQSFRVPSIFLLFACPCVSWSPSEYPEYCTKDIEKTAIPPLADSLRTVFGNSVSLSDVEMVQVQTVLRHGARTPFEAYPCWAGYRETWDCDVTELIVPTPSALSGLAGGGPPWLFRKLYDAYPKRNLLGGTCLVGQLITEGYIQELQNGRQLRDAYVCADGSHCLFSSARLEDINLEELYLRSDDQQRVVMSGQLVTLGLFDADGEVVLPWHTGDYSLDWMVPNPNYCPRLKGLLDDVKASEGWQELFYRGSDMAAANASIERAWNVASVDWDSALDCVMTSACTDRPLPDTMDQELLDQVVDMSERYENYKHFWEGGKYARTGMAPLVGHLRRHMTNALNGIKKQKFVLYAGHDTTLQPLLAALAPGAWDGRWPAYASLLVIEVMRIRGDAHVRMVYNGKVMRLEGCSADICPMDDFIEATLWADNPEKLCGADGGSGGSGSGSGGGGGGGSGLGQGPEVSVDGNVMMAFAAACFIVGLLSGGVPTAMYYKRFTYEKLMMVSGGDRGALDRSGSSSHVAARSVVQFVGLDRTEGIRSRVTGEANMV